MMKARRAVAVFTLLFFAAIGRAQADPPLVKPNFLLPLVDGASDYRPTLNHNGKRVVFERTIDNATQLYIAILSSGTAQPFTGIAGAARADWCWRRNGATLLGGPVAFSSGEGVYVVSGNGLSPALLPNTANMIYPTWFPNCRYLAVDVANTHATAKINARSGRVVTPNLGDDDVWAGFASVNQANPKLISFAGQYNKQSSYYNQELNYTWVADRSSGQKVLRTMDRKAPQGPAFLQKFQARAGTWSPDGKWFAFESNRVCDNIDGQTYAIFIQDSAGTFPAMQVTSCKWNSQHPKWFPPGSTGRKTLLIAAIAPVGLNKPFRIASLNVTTFVGD